MTLPQWALLAAVLGPLFAAWPGVATPYTLPKLLVLAAGTAAATLGLGRAAAAGPRPPSGQSPDILRPLAACVIVWSLSCAFSSDPWLSLLGEYEQRGSGLLTLALCAAAAVLVQGAGAAFAGTALNAGAAAGAALAAVGVLQLFGLDPVLNAVGGLAYGRVGSLTGSPIALGCVLAMLLPLQLRMALDGADAARRRMGWAFLGAGLAGLLLTWSRGAWGASAAAAACYLAWTGRLGRPKTRGTWLMLGAAAVLGAAALTLAAGRFRPTRESDAGRAAVWESAMLMFQAHPLLGVGPDAFGLMLGRYKTERFVRAYGEAGTQANAHNDLLHVLASAGAAGLAAYLWLLACAWRRLRRALSDEGLRTGSAAAGAGLAAAFIAAKFNPVNIDGLALAALLLGLLDPRGVRPRAFSKAAPLLTAAAVAATGWLMLADRSCMQGMRAQHEGRLDDARQAYAAAARLNPAECRYGFWLVGLLRDSARAEKDPARRLALGAEAVTAARAMERRHPLDVRALHALGGSLAALTLQGGPDSLSEAAAVLDRGPGADWSYRALLETRSAVADIRGDLRTKEDSALRLARLESLRPKIPY
ncbi:MAG: O-antigen ligase family protein [Elusimicrobia bacterium]|nr:O-antigen ligase family protein [Elusimicrobiota bacterium]